MSSSRPTAPGTWFLALCVSVVYPSFATAGFATYRITNLGTLGGSGSVGHHLNERGEVVGNSVITNQLGTHGYIWRNGVMADLGTLGGSESDARAINDSGQVVGQSGTAFLWQNGVMTNLGTLGGGSSFARGINNAGKVVGGSEVIDGTRSYLAPFLWSNGVMTQLGIFGGGSYATDINDSDQIIGSYIAASGPGSGAFRLQNGVFTDLGSLGGRFTEVHRINNLGVVAGESQVTGTTYYHAFSWSNGVMTDLGTLGGLESGALGINDAGAVVGVSRMATGSVRAFLWQQGTMVDLNDHIDPDSGWTLDVAMGINNTGQIVGTGTYNGQTRAYLLTPVPVPGGLTLVTTAVVTLLATRWTRPRRGTTATVRSGRPGYPRHGRDQQP